MAGTLEEGLSCQEQGGQRSHRGSRVASAADRVRRAAASKVAECVVGPAPGKGSVRVVHGVQWDGDVRDDPLARELGILARGELDQHRAAGGGSAGSAAVTHRLRFHGGAALPVVGTAVFTAVVEARVALDLSQPDGGRFVEESLELTEFSVTPAAHIAGVEGDGLVTCLRSVTGAVEAGPPGWVADALRAASELAR